MTQPTLRLVKPAESEAPGASVSGAEFEAASARLVRFLRKRPGRLKASPLRVLDYSPVGMPIAGWLGETGVSVVRLAESETAAELLRDADEGAEVLVCPLDGLQGLLAPGAFHVVHTAFVLGHRRELPMMTALTQLGRAATEGFVWSDRKPARRVVRDVASRVELGFCGYRRPIGSSVFTLSGWRPAL